MPEMVIPGTYITVRSEGLISAGRIATGIVGIIGTAARGPINEPITLSGFAEAREIFGRPDPFDQPITSGSPLTLVRALEQLYNNGASSVVAVRVARDQTSDQASDKLSAARYAVLSSTEAEAPDERRNSSRRTVVTLVAKTPGSWGNDIQIEITLAEDDCRMVGEIHESLENSEWQLRYSPIVNSPENRIQVGQSIKTIVYPQIVHERISLERLRLENVPILADAAMTEVKVTLPPRDEEAEVEVVIYTGDRITYGDNDPPANGIQINPDTGEIRFATEPDPRSEINTTYQFIPSPNPGEVVIHLNDGTIDFANGEEPSNENGDLVASYLVSRDRCATVRLTYETILEQYDVPDAFQLASQVNRSSDLVSAVADEAIRGTSLATGINQFLGRGSNTRGNNGATAGSNEYAAGLENIANQLINIVVLAGQDTSTSGTELLAHLRQTEQTNYERIGVIGASGTSVQDFLGHNMASDRVILVAPGLAFPDGSTLPPAYTAAAIAGLISSLPVQTSLTNRPVVVPGLTLNINRGQQAQLIRRNVVTVIPKQGYRVLKGITTSGEGTPFSAIPTRRIVDFAKYGVRSAADPYMGRLNNSRVRSALQATLDAFLTRMVEDEALTGYDLEVSATRAQEIAGEVSVTMTLMPTFSIEFIRVTMILH